MKFSDTVLGLIRRWYIVLPGLLIAASVAAGAWFAVPPEYDRSATQLLVPGDTSVPEGGNPYLFLGGLAPAADVLVRAIGSENVLHEVVEEHPGVDIKIVRDTSTAGPIILIRVTASTDAAAENVLNMLVGRTATVLDEFQAAENVPAENRLTVIPVTVDEQSTELTRDRALAAAGAGSVIAVLVLLVASLVDGSSQRRRKHQGARGEAHDPDVPRGSSDTQVAVDADRAVDAAPAHLDESFAERSDGRLPPVATRPRVKV